MTWTRDSSLPAAPPPLPDVATFLDHVHRGDGGTALGLVADHMRHGGAVTEVVAELLAPAQHEVGERWHRGSWSVADEHMASAVVEDALGVLAAHLTRSSHTQRLTLVCAEGEWHTTPARMAALTLRDAGWHVDFLGGSTPPEHLRSALDHTRPHVLAVSATLPLSLTGVPPVIDVAHRLDIPVLAGGAAFGTTGHRARVLNADGHAPHLGRAAGMLTGWLDHPPTRPMDASNPDVQRERAPLQRRREAVLVSAYAHLEHAVPAMKHYSEAQRVHTRRDLDYTLQFLDVALLVEDPGLFREYAAWLDVLLTHRGVPPGMLRTSFDAIARTLGADLVHAQGILADSLATPAA